MFEDPAIAARSAFTTNPPQFSVLEIEALVRERYGIAGSAVLLTSERDLTVRIDAAAGQSFVLKIANAAEDPLVAEFQNRALQHLATAAPEVPASRLVPTLAGETEFFAEHLGERHFTRLLTFLPGRILSGTPATPGQMHNLGTALGRLAKALAGFHHPAEDHEIVWDIRRAGQLHALTGHIHDAGLRAQVEGILARFRDEIMPRQETFRRQVVHNDFNPFNLLVDPQDNDRITGILDFGDLVSTPTIYDLAVACSYQVALEGPPLRFAANLVSAYHAVHPILEDEADRLFDLMAVRAALSVTIAEWRASRYKENAAYILRNHAKAAAAIERFAATPRDEAQRILRAAAGFA